MRSRWKNVLTAAALLALCILATGAKSPETYGIAAAAFPEPGVMTAGQPTGEQIQLAAEDGYKTILDLRTPAEPRGFDEAEAARQNGLAYVNVPVSPTALDQAAIDRFLAAMKRAQKPVLIHGGADSRVGALWYAWLVLEKRMSQAAALAEARVAGLRQPEMKERIEKLVAERKPPGSVRSPLRPWSRGAILPRGSSTPWPFLPALPSPASAGSPSSRPSSRSSCWAWRC